MHDVHVKQNTDLPCQKQHSKRRVSLHGQVRFKFKEETSEVLHLGRSFVWL
jgi:hypothetical protein